MKASIGRRLVGVVLALIMALAMVAVPTAAPKAVSSYASVVAQAAEIGMSPTLPGVVLPSGSNSIGSADLVKDYAGNRFDVYLETNGNDTRIHMVKRSAAGAVVAEAVAVPDNGPNGLPRKLNSAAATIDGSNLIVVGTAYDLTSPTRAHYPMSATWAGVAVPYPSGVNPAQGAGGPIYTGEGQPPGEPVNYQLMRDIVREEVRAALGLGSTDLVTAIAGKPTSQGGSIRQGLEDKAKDSAREMIDKSNPEQKAQEYQFLLGQFTKDRVFEVLKENGVITPTKRVMLGFGP